MKKIQRRGHTTTVRTKTDRQHKEKHKKQTS